MAPLNDTSFVNQISKEENFFTEHCRPWSELFLATDNGNGNNNSGAFSKPESLAGATSRVLRNAEYFCGNYVRVVLVAVFLTLLGNSLSLLVVFLVAASWCMLLLLGRRRLVVGNDADLAGLVVTTIVALLLSGAAATVLAGVAAGCGVSVVHATFRAPN